VLGLWGILFLVAYQMDKMLFDLTSFPVMKCLAIRKIR
jgi:hypothetical protein